jgi:hypothetical protein
MLIQVPSKLLYAYAQTHNGSQFTEQELHCRIVNAMTDENYTIEDAYVLQFYGAWDDRGSPREYTFNEIRVDFTPQSANLVEEVRALLEGEFGRSFESIRQRYLHVKELMDGYFEQWLLQKP